MKRFISCNASELLKMNGKELKESIKASEGRVIVSENVVTREPIVPDITNAEIARSFGADLILLNVLDVFNPKIWGIEIGDNFVDQLKKLAGRPIGVNLEPIDNSARMMEDRYEIPKGRQANKETFEEVERLGMNFVCLTGNPGTGVSNKEIETSISLAKKYYSGLIIAGKMHSSGVNEPVMTPKVASDFINQGADVILVPAVGTVPGFTSDELKDIVDLVHKRDALVMSAIGTSQETSSIETIRDFGIQNKICGVDMQHIGDSGYGGLAPYENIYELSKAIRGVRHTVSMISRSINR